MGLTRRQAIMASLGAIALGGCSSTARTSRHPRPIAPWAGYPANPSNRTAYTPVQAPPRQTIVQPKTPGVVTPAGVAAISRSKWTRTGPVKSKVNAMSGISKVTIHHEGWTAVNFTSQSATAERLEKIRKYHVGENRWGDIGYHYIVDRAGRVWEGRPIQYQGAHVSQNNEHNVGILVLGNFDKQSPSSAQLKSMYHTVAVLTKQHKIKTKLVRSHKEISTTACPGKNLQAQMNALRRHVG
ncbi:MAG: peptidoglycan recognition protein family protein [Phycisphaeraceae bacterium]|nr:peptidoglycan recognition protein family protein [Phycisphaeraceae bacterium]